MLKVVEDAIVKNGWTLNSSLGSAVGSEVATFLKGLYSHPKYEGQCLSTEKAKDAIDQRYKVAVEAADKLATECICGICENPVEAFNKLEETEW